MSFHSIPIHFLFLLFIRFRYFHSIHKSHLLFLRFSFYVFWSFFEFLLPAKSRSTIIVRYLVKNTLIIDIHSYHFMSTHTLSLSQGILFSLLLFDIFFISSLYFILHYLLFTIIFYSNFHSLFVVFLFFILCYLYFLVNTLFCIFHSFFFRYKKFQGEWDDFAAEEQAFKKFKKGKLSKDVYEDALLAESAPDEHDIEVAAKKGKELIILILILILFIYLVVYSFNHLMSLILFFYPSIHVFCQVTCQSIHMSSNIPHLTFHSIPFEINHNLLQYYSSLSPIFL